MIHDYIVLGLLDDGLSEEMLLDPKLTLEKAVSMAYQSKVVNNQQGIVRGTSHDSSELQRVWKFGGCEFQGQVSTSYLKDGCNQTTYKGVENAR